MVYCVASRTGSDESIEAVRKTRARDTSKRCLTGVMSDWQWKVLGYNENPTLRPSVWQV